MQLLTLHCDKRGQQKILGGMRSNTLTCHPTGKLQHRSCSCKTHRYLAGALALEIPLYVKTYEQKEYLKGQEG